MILGTVFETSGSVVQDQKRYERTATARPSTDASIVIFEIGPSPVGFAMTGARVTFPRNPAPVVHVPPTQRALVALRTAAAQWCEDERDAPNSAAFAVADQLDEAFVAAGMQPTYVDASPEGGVLFSFLIDVRHAAIEAFNTGEIVAVISHLDRESEVFEVVNDAEDVAVALRRISDYLR